MTSVSAIGVIVGVIFAILELRNLIKNKKDRPRNETVLNIWKQRIPRSISDNRNYGFY